MFDMFETMDFDLAAYLYTLAYPLLSVECSDEFSIFTFPGEAAVSAEAYYQGASVPAKNLLYAVHSLRSRVRRDKSNEYTIS